MYMILVNLITFMHSISNLYMIYSKLIHVYAYIYIFQVSCEYLMLLLNLKNCMHVKAEMWTSGNSGCNWSRWELCIFGFVKREKIKLWLEILSFINLNEQNVKIITGKLSGILSRHPYLLLFFEHDHCTLHVHTSTLRLRSIYIIIII